MKWKRVSEPKRSVVRAMMMCFASLMLAALLERPLLADDDPDPLDRELLDALQSDVLQGRSVGDSPEQLVPRLIEGTRAASNRLRQGQLDPQTSALQEQILKDIDALLEQSSSPPSQPPQNSSSSNSPTQPQGSPGQGQQQDEPSESAESRRGDHTDPNARSRESEQRNTGGTPGEVEREERLKLSTAAWGHLPPKVREQMRSAFSEEYLPEYDALVRRYYEALARRRSSTSSTPD